MYIVGMDPAVKLSLNTKNKGAFNEIERQQMQNT